MGSSEGGEGGIGMECGVGTIVWVRRRNGSWWPGRILGQHELSASHLMSPRSGTPVKLLGREDASVDWYNLEKSKRVKAFRCGEFDACIERAEASLGGPMRKREKYARREDAILHALELEKRQLEVKELPSPLIGLPKLSDEPVFIKPKLSNSLSTREDETSGSMPRIKGSQKKLERSKSSIIEDQDDGLHDNSSSVKRKRPQGMLTEDSLTKRRDRRRPLAQVLKSSAKLEVLVPPQPSDSNSGDKFLPEDSAGNSSDDIPISLVDYGFASNGLQVPSSSVDDTASSEMEAEDFLLEEAESFLDDDEDAVGKIGGGGDSLSNDEGDDGGADPGMSMWHLKGKRNVRAQPFYPKKKGSGAASRLFNGGGDETELSEPSAFGWSSSSFWAVDEEDLLELPRNRTLIEVDLKVQTSYQGERVPLVSLMSRLNGKAIIGHPVPVEILEDGGAADLAAAAERALGGGADAHPAAAPVWRTGRRTAMHRVPRAHLVPSTEDAELDCGSVIKKKVAAKAKKKLQKKGMISLSNQKTRTLSSIVTERRRSGKSRHGGGGLIKPGSGVVPPVTCVPITVVFSRIMEAVGRPPSSMAGARQSLLPPQDTRPSSSSSSLL